MITNSEPPARLPIEEDSERTVIGSLILAPKYLPTVRTRLGADDFFDTGLRCLYEAICEVSDGSRGGVDATLLISHLRDSGDYEAVGGMAFLADLLHAPHYVPHNVVFHAERMLTASRQRQLITAAEGASESLLSGANVDGVIEKLNKGVAEVRPQADSTPSLNEIVHRCLDDLERKEPSGVVLKSGWHQLDRLLGGLRAPGLIVVGGRTGMGKSVCLQNLCCELAVNQGKSVLACTLEMNSQEWVNRMICSLASVDSRRYRDRNLDQGDTGRIGEIAGTLAGAPLTLSDASGQTLGSIRQKAIEVAQRDAQGLSAVVVDYLQLVKGSDSRKKRYEQVGEVAGGLKDLARDLNIPVIAAAQVSRDVKDRKDTRPRLSDLRESGDIENAADVVLFVHRPGYYSTNERPNKGEFIVAKNRHGAVGQIELVWEAEYQRFDNTGMREDQDEFF